MGCPSCLVQLSGPDGMTVRRSTPFGDEPTALPSLGSLGAFVLAGAAAFVVLSLAIPEVAKRASR